MNETPIQPSTAKTMIVGAHVTPEFAERFRKIAEAEHRTVSAEIRRLMERRVTEYEEGSTT
jgi:hypothetical protein